MESSEPWLPAQAGFHGYCNTPSFMCFVALCGDGSSASTVKMEKPSLCIGKSCFAVPCVKWQLIRLSQENKDLNLTF